MPQSYNCSLYAIGPATKKASRSMSRQPKVVNALKRKERAERWIAQCLGIAVPTKRQQRPIDIGEYE